MTEQIVHNIVYYAFEAGMVLTAIRQIRAQRKKKAKQNLNAENDKQVNRSSRDDDIQPM